MNCRNLDATIGAIMTLDSAWAAFDRAAAADPAASILEQFDRDPGRLERFSLEAAGLWLDLSKQAWTRDGFETCLALTRAAGVEAARAALFAGEPINRSERRAVLHPALRAPDGADFHAAGEPVSRRVEAVRAQMREFAAGVRDGTRTGCTGKPFRSLIHIGIGGSELGPRLAWEALRPLDAAIDLRFVANIDPEEFAAAIHGLDPETTLVVVVSKSFSTAETSTNLARARAWLEAGLPAGGAAGHITAVTAAEARARAADCGEIFAFDDWVGGRFSLWSAVGLSCAVALGWEVFEGVLAGGAAMDAHFLAAPLERNAPVLMALAGIWNVNALGRDARAVIPYAARLARLPAFLQQLEMESNGKSVRDDGAPVGRDTCPVVFGEPGANAQHAFFQMLHQGTRVVPVDFITVAGEPGLLTNAVAQAEALLVGKPVAAAAEELAAAGAPEAQIAALAPQKAFAGNRPSSFLVLPRLDGPSLGALLALYEHKTFVEGVIWGINSFDQWGVELGKTLAKAIEGGSRGGAHDPSTEALLDRLLPR